MNFFGFLSLLGGLGLFLYGMTIMGSGLEKLAGGKTESILKKLTSSLPRGVLLGTLVTAVIQSSSATTVIAIGLVNSGLMNFTQSLGIVMGANVGTTVTGQILRLSELSGDNFIIRLFKPESLSPISIIFGVSLLLFAKRLKNKNIGQILIGFGILFTGMLAMESAVYPLRDSEVFLSMFAKLENPLLGVLAGFTVTAIIQSSSASIGILQALTATGAVAWANAVPIILGQNIGTCVTGLLASIGANKAGKRVAFSHIYFNVIGTGIFMAALYLARPLMASFWNNSMSMGDIANFHTFFNIITTVIFIPFNGLLVKLSYMTVPKDKTESHPELTNVVLDVRLYASPSTAIAQARSAVARMAELAFLVQKSSLDIVLKKNPADSELAYIRENLTDQLEVSITNYLVGITKLDLTDEEGREAATLLSFVNEFERIGDRGINIIQTSGVISEKEIGFSKLAVAELKVLENAVNEVCQLAIDAFSNRSIDSASKVEPLEETVDAICETIHSRHIRRLKDGTCSIEAGVVFLEVLNNYERISDHCSNIAARILSSTSSLPDTHSLLRELHMGRQAQYSKWRTYFEDKYRLPMLPTNQEDK
jgi:phosphate:Na+ symporter